MEDVSNEKKKVGQGPVGNLVWLILVGLIAWWVYQSAQDSIQEREAELAAARHPEEYADRFFGERKGEDKVRTTVYAGDDSGRDDVAAAWGQRQGVGSVVTTDNQTSRGGSVMVVVERGEGWSAEAQYTSYLDDVRRFVPAVMAKFDLDAVELAMELTFVDQRGNSSKQSAVRSSFTKANAAKINWKNVLTKNVPKIADDYWIHPGYARAIAEKE